MHTCQCPHCHVGHTHANLTVPSRASHKSFRTRALSVETDLSMKLRSRHLNVILCADTQRAQAEGLCRISAALNGSAAVHPLLTRVGSALPGHSRSRERWDVAGAVRRARNHLTQGIACRAEPPPHTTPLLRQMWPLWSAARHAPLQALAAPSRTGEARLEGPTHAQTRMIDAICAAQVHMSPSTPLAAMMPPCSLNAHPFCRLFGLVHFSLRCPKKRFCGE